MNCIQSISEVSPSRYLITIPRSRFLEDNDSPAEIFIVDAESGNERAMLTAMEGLKSFKNTNIFGNWMLHSYRKEFNREYTEKNYCGIHIAHTNSPKIYFSLKDDLESK